MSWQTTFPDYDNGALFAETLAALRASGLDARDDSYRHDACPAIACGDARLFVDYADKRLREFAHSTTLSGGSNIHTFWSESVSDAVSGMALACGTAVPFRG